MSTDEEARGAQWRATSGARNFITSVLSAMYFFSLSHLAFSGPIHPFACEAAGTR
jgi:hypothetical protein